MKPQLIDSYKANGIKTAHGYKMAKPLRLFRLRDRFHHAYLVFTGKATAVHFFEDLHPAHTYQVRKK